MKREKRAISAILSASLVGLAAFSIATIPTGGSNGSLEIFAAGYLFGSVFGNAVMAAAWAALGPGWFLIRLPLSFLWIFLISLAVFGNAWMNHIPLREGVIVGLCLIGIWLVVQIPYWLLRAIGDLTLQDSSIERKQSRSQYGIGQLLIFTSIIAITFGIGRAVAGLLPVMGDLGGFAHIFQYLSLAIAAALISLPLPLAILMPRYAGYAILGIMILNVVATLIELPLLKLFFAAPGPQFMHFVWLNFFAAAWILAFGGLVRFAGYRLAANG